MNYLHSSRAKQPAGWEEIAVKQLRWLLLLLVPVTVLVATSCTPADTATAEKALSLGSVVFLAIVGLVNAATLVGQHPGGGFAFCFEGFLCHYFG